MAINTRLNLTQEILVKRLNTTKDFFQRNKKISQMFLLVVVGIGVGIYLYLNYLRERRIQAYNELFPAVFYYEKDSVDKALNGDNNFTRGFISIIEDYSNTKAANLASFYAGIIYLEQGDYQRSIELLKDTDLSDELLKPRTYSLIGDAYIELKDYEQAIEFYTKAAKYNSKSYFTPRYLMKLAIAFEGADDSQKAKDTYQTIIDEYPFSEEFAMASKYVSLINKL